MNGVQVPDFGDAHVFTVSLEFGFDSDRHELHPAQVELGRRNPLSSADRRMRRGDT